MAFSVQMPALGEGVTEGTVTRWLKATGDRIEADEPLLEVSTDKVDTEIPAPVGGVLKELKAGAGETVEIGAELAVIEDTTAAAPSTQVDQAAPSPAPPVAAGRRSSATAPYVTPLVRKLAAEHRVDLSSLTGTGANGRVRKQDVLAAVKAAPALALALVQAPVVPAPAPAPTPAAAGTAAPRAATVVAMPRLRQVIAQRMTDSLRISAQLTAVQEADVTRIAHLRVREKEGFLAREGVKLTYLPFFAKAAIEALKDFPAMNSSLSEDGKHIEYHDAVHLAIAVDAPRGLIVPVIRSADDLSLAGLARKITDVAARARANEIGADELSGGTFTITNIGSAGSLFDTPIINQPQVAILGTGAIVKEPKVVDGPDGEDVIAVRQVCYLPLTYDHRVIDGADAGRFLGAIKARLEEGQFAAELGG
ncbi:2-oxoglutarate dehydrogenase, E2 component, dihydrolipoamide succinyltransferase [Saccharopolyspora hattusasensis]|uniref:2-oxoglutarate dehydrogenase, E2 component, dihydrolipoamide succinyltransferase n=1 Tax=Saccharopolyspora hattusasensis TaxID=1128679 RepID=UPI003D950FD1